MTSQTATVRLRRVHEGGRQRQARYRLRQAMNCVHVGTDFTPEETAKLCRLQYLTENQLEDREAIADAVHELLAKIDM